jgi:magnesium chelatase subunit D
VRPGEKGFELAVAATLKRAALRRLRLGRQPPSGRLVTTDDLCKKLRCRPCESLIVLLVDASGSMGEGAEARMRAAKGAVLALLRQTYHNRGRVALNALGGEAATVVLPPTSSISLAQKRLERLPAGGATPFADGLRKARQLVQRERIKNPGLRPVLVIISDGEANVPLTEGMPPWEELLRLAEPLRQDKLGCVLIDVVAEPDPAPAMRHLAMQMGATYVKITDLKSRHILAAVHGGNSPKNFAP